MTHRRLGVAVLAFFAIVACAVAGQGGSGANFTTASSNSAEFASGDWVAPAVTLTAPSAARLASRRPTFGGAAGTASGDAGSVTVRIYAGASTGGTQAQALTAAASGATWSATPVIDLPDGTYTAQAEQADAAGHLGKSAAVTFTVDATAPAPTVTSPSGAVMTPSFTGTAGAATGDDSTVTLTVTKSGGTPQTYTATRSGTTWTATVPTLAEGDYTVTASQSDDVGNTGTSSAASFTVDRTAPAVTLTTPAAGASTNASTPALAGARGTATGDVAGVTVNLYSGASATGTPVQTRTATVSGGGWSATAAAIATDGTYTAQAVQTDAAGNTGKSSAVTFVVDRVAPSPTITAPTGFTSTTPVLSGTAGNATGDGATVKVEILSGTTVVQTLTPTRAATTWSATAATLAQGSYTAQVTQSDAAGNASTSATIAFTVDTVGPAVTVTSPVTGSATNNVTPTVSGAAGTAAGDLAPITVVITNTATGVAQTRNATASGGAWSVAATTLLNGSYTVRASQSDSAGNTTTTAAVTFTVDTVAPTAPTVTTPTGFVTTRTPTITGTAANAAGDDSTVTVEILSGASVVQTLSAPRTGTSWSIAVPAALTEGATYSARARQGDSAGNTSVNSAPTTFVVDTIAPTVTLAAPATGTYTNSTTPTFSGTASAAAGDLATVTVRIYDAGGTLVQTPTATVVAGAWSVAATALAQGAYTARASQSDGAGNTGTSATNGFTIDTTAPTPSGVTTTNAAGGTPGVFDLGDTITFTYSEAMDPATVVTGWNGTGSQAVTLNFTNGATDSFTVTNAGGTVHLTTNVVLNATFLKKNWTDSAATLTRVSATQYRITLGTSVSSSAMARNPASAGNIAWAGDAGAKDLAGNGATGTFTETDNDVDF